MEAGWHPGERMRLEGASGASPSVGLQKHLLKNLHKGLGEVRGRVEYRRERRRSLYFKGSERKTASKVGCCGVIQPLESLVRSMVFKYRAFLSQALLPPCGPQDIAFDL